MPPESMAQSIYDIGGQAFFLDPDDEALRDDYFALTQDASAASQSGRGSVPLSSVQVEGFTKVLRHGLSAWVSIALKVIVEDDADAVGPIVLDFGPLLTKHTAGGFVGGGIPGFTGLVLAGAGGQIDGSPLANAGWALVLAGNSILQLVDHDGAPITTQLGSGDRLAIIASFCAVND